MVRKTQFLKQKYFMVSEKYYAVVTFGDTKQNDCINGKEIWESKMENDCINRMKYFVEIIILRQTKIGQKTTKF
jgi:hypothetical protein